MNSSESWSAGGIASFVTRTAATSTFVASGRAKGVSLEATVEELARYMVGWRNYFGFCETPEVLSSLTGWVRRRLRCALWRQWRTARRRRAALIALGVGPVLARNTAASYRGPWSTSQNKTLHIGLSNAYFRSLGLPSLAEKGQRDRSNRPCTAPHAR